MLSTSTGGETIQRRERAGRHMQVRLTSDSKGSQKAESRRALSLVFLLLLASLMPLAATASTSTTRSTTVWSGTVVLQDGYTVGIQDILIVQAGTTIQLGNDKDLTVDGRLSIQGTALSPVVLESILGKHDGIIFNQSSQGLGSSIDNLSVEDAEWGVTIYGSDPVLTNVKVINADRVAVDLFDGATPRIYNLRIEGGGQDLHGASTSWRYGIGLSVGAYSAPIVDGFVANGLITRALNYWGNSGGMVSNLEITNITGATLAVATGIWIEDSLPLITDIDIDRCDNGIFVRHITTGWTTRPTFVRAVVANSMYRGVMVEQYNHSQFSNIPAHAVFNDLEVRGTGGADAKTPGLGVAAFEVNTSGVIIDDALIEDNPVVGFKAYMIGSSTIINGLTLDGNGRTTAASPINDRAGLFMRSVNWAPVINDLIVSNSTGPGVLLWKGGAIGQDWQVFDNGASGVDFREFHPDITILVSHDNARHGVSVRDSSNVELQYVVTYRNGIGTSFPESGAGFYFDEANDLMSGGKNVTCFTCTSVGDQHGIVVRDSIDLQLRAIEVHDPLSGPGIDIDNNGLTRDGFVILDDVRVNMNSSGYAIEMDEVNALVNGLDLSGNNGGVYWKAGETITSHLVGSIISGIGGTCLDLVDHHELLATNVGLSCSTGSPPTVESSFVNFTDSGFIPGSAHETSFMMEGNSHLRWISSGAMADPTYDGLDNILDVMWFVEVHAVNQLAHHIPYALANLSFSAYESPLNGTLPYSGIDTFGPFIGNRWMPSTGWSGLNTVNVGCDYVGVHNDSAAVLLDQDRMVNCRLDLPNQPPFIIWNSPEDEAEYPSGSEVLFDAAASWDLDDDPLTYSWTSDVADGIDCLQGSSDNGSVFLANEAGTSREGCLADGEHEITLEVCDDEGKCVSETRTIELFNQPPRLSVSTSPSISSWGIMHLGRTANATIDLDGTDDPENDPLTCWIETSYGFSTPTDEGCGMIFDIGFPNAPTQFTLTVHLSDGNNPDVTWSFSVRLFNEVPVAQFDVVRAGQTSAHLVRLDGTMVFDPEGDEVRYEFWSDRDGLLGEGTTPADTVEWQGWLSEGIHSITMYASDERAVHTDTWTSTSALVSVNNSAPIAVIALPADGILTDSGTLIRFDSTGSGDWDLACDSLPDNGSGFVCNPTTSTSTDLVSVIWSSDRLSEPFASGWVVDSRLPKGHHTITLTVDDGSGAIVSAEITVRVEEAAPILILDSPMPDAEVFSNLPVLFDFRRSFDPDGDSFTVTVTSSLMLEPILEAKTNEYWYNDYIPAGAHELTFVLRDSTERVRTHTQMLYVMETAPVAVITTLLDGQYIPPGTQLTLDASQSYDYDDDIVLFQWTTSTGTLLGDRDIIEVQFAPGAIRIDLLVKDSRGASSTASLNLTIGSSSPVLTELQVHPRSIDADEPTSVTVTIRLDDADGTTQSVLGEMTAGGEILNLAFHDDGLEGDAQAGDGVWSYRGVWLVSEGNWVRVEVWAIDGELVSPSLTETISINKPQTTNILAWLAGSGMPYFIGLLVILVLVGMAHHKQRSEAIRRDLEMIESWSTFNPRDLDEEFNDDSPDDV